MLIAKTDISEFFFVVHDKLILILRTNEFVDFIFVLGESDENYFLIKKIIKDITIFASPKRFEK